MKNSEFRQLKDLLTKVEKDLVTTDISSNDYTKILKITFKIDEIINDIYFRSKP